MFSYRLFISVLWLEIKLSRSGVWDPISRLNPSHVCAGAKPGHRFPTTCVGVFFMFSELK